MQNKIKKPIQPYYKTEESVEEYIKLAKDVDGADHIEVLKRFLTNGSRLLEIGSGLGSDWEILDKDYEVTGSDFSEQFLVRLRQKYPKGEFLTLNASTLTTDQMFDGIYSNKVLHHLQNEELKSSSESQHNILNHNGIICHTFWKGSGDEVFKGMYVNYHDHDALRKFFEPQFEILQLEDYAEFENNDSIRLIAKKK